MSAFWACSEGAIRSWLVMTIVFSFLPGALAIRVLPNRPNASPQVDSNGRCNSKGLEDGAAARSRGSLLICAVRAQLGSSSPPLHRPNADVAVRTVRTPALHR